MYYYKSHELTDTSKRKPDRPDLGSGDHLAAMGGHPVQAVAGAGMKAQPEVKRGRPALPEEEKTVPGSVRLTPARWEKLRRLGAQWLAKAIDRAKEPKE